MIQLPTGTHAAGIAVTADLDDADLALWADTEVRNRQSLEEMRRGHCGRRVLFQGSLKLWIVECGTEVGDGFPHCVVHEHAAAGDSLMELSRNEAGLPFHP
jgi:hypothetical protein